MLQNRVLRRIFGSKREEVMRGLPEGKRPVRKT
jgi:hypothetical protein